jgi:hypothetical protein
MTAGYVLFAAILVAIGAFVMNSLPSFARNMRIGLDLAASRYWGHIRPSRRARIIPFRASRTAAR